MNVVRERHCATGRQGRPAPAAAAPPRGEGASVPDALQGTEREASEKRVERPRLEGEEGCCLPLQRAQASGRARRRRALPPAGWGISAPFPLRGRVVPAIAEFGKCQVDGAATQPPSAVAVDVTNDPLPPAAT